MSEPLNTRTLQHFLDFKSDDTGLIEIDEPIGFDAANFVIEQRSDGYGRDISFAGGETEFTFSSQENKFGHQFNKLIEYARIYGFEADVDYILREGAVDYIVGQVDFQTKNTDELRFFSCAMIQSAEQAILERRSDVKVDLYGTEDMDGNTIAPITTQNILLRAKPITEQSSWVNSSIAYATSVNDPAELAVNQNNIFTSEIFRIQDSLSGGLSKVIVGGSNFYNDIYNNFPYIDAQNDLSDVEISITDLEIDYYNNAQNQSELEAIWTALELLKIDFSVYVMPIGVSYPFDGGSGFANLDKILSIDTYTIEGTFQNNGIQTIPPFIGDANSSVPTGSAYQWSFNFNDLSITVPLVPRGYRVCAFFNVGARLSIADWVGGKVEISATSTSIASVVDGVRFIDATNKVREAIDNTFELNAPRFEQGGEWYDNFVFSGNMLRGLNRFELDFDQIKNHLPEFHADYETDFKKLFLGKYDDFYNKTEIGAFLINPNAEFDISFNERHTINTFNFNYKSYDQDRFNENTIDAIHTETQWLLPNRLVENTKDIECEFVRDPYLLEATRRKAFEVTSASVQEDDEVFIVDTVPLPENSFGGFTAILSHQWNSADNKVKLLNDGSFNWELLGFDVGDDFFITPAIPPNTSPNQGNYTVSDIERTVITLDEVASSNLDPTTGEGILTSVIYPLTNVTLVNRTNEGFDSITGLIDDDRYSNLLYSPKRNILNNYGSYLSTCTKYKQEDIRNTKYKNWTNRENPLITQYEGGAVINEIEKITQDELEEPILTPRIINTKVLCDFSTYLEYADKLKTDRGFVRVYDNEGRVLKGFVKNSDFLWAENSLTLTLEEMQVSEIISISFANSMFYIDEVGYDEDIVTDIVYKVDDLSYIQFFDRYGRPLTNKLRFEYVSVGGQLFDTVDELIEAIDDLDKPIVEPDTFDDTFDETFK